MDDARRRPRPRGATARGLGIEAKGLDSGRWTPSTPGLLALAPLLARGLTFGDHEREPTELLLPLKVKLEGLRMVMDCEITQPHLRAHPEGEQLVDESDRATARL